MSHALRALVALLLCHTARAAFAFTRQLHRPLRRPAIKMCAAAPDELAVLAPPDGTARRALAAAKPSPALQPREVINIVLSALHKSAIDSPYPLHGCEVALRFLAPTNPASLASVQLFSDYLQQTWYQPLLNWGQYRWEGDLTFIGEREAYQQVSVRPTTRAPWVSVRWILVRVPFSAATADQWMVQSVFVEEPDGGTPIAFATPERAEARGAAARGAVEPASATHSEAPADVVLRVMRALRNNDEPYPLHGCEVAIRYCSPTNRAARLSPAAFAQYLSEPWYRVMTEWAELELEELQFSRGGSSASQDVLVKRRGDDTWTLVNWQLSRHAGRWLTDALTITCATAAAHAQPRSPSGAKAAARRGHSAKRQKCRCARAGEGVAGRPPCRESCIRPRQWRGWRAMSRARPTARCLALLASSRSPFASMCVSARAASEPACSSPSSMCSCPFVGWARASAPGRWYILVAPTNQRNACRAPRAPPLSVVGARCSWGRGAVWTVHGLCRGVARMNYHDAEEARKVRDTES